MSTSTIGSLHHESLSTNVESIIFGENDACRATSFSLKSVSTVVETEARVKEDPLPAAEAAIRLALAEIPGVQLVPALQRDPHNPSAVFFEFVAPISRKQIVAVVLPNGEPLKTRAALFELQSLINAYRTGSGYGIIVAPYISDRSAQLCEEARAGYVDFAGNCRIAFDGIFISKRGAPNPFAEKRDLRSLYSAKAERVLRVLLNNPRRRWQVQAMAKEAQVSLGQASNVKKLLEEREWAKAGKDGFGLLEPEALLKEWAQQYRFARNEVQSFYSIKPVAEIEDALARDTSSAPSKLAFTQFSGAARFAPIVKYQRVSAYVSGDIGALADRVGLKATTSGANVTLISPYDEGVFYGGRDNSVSPVQCYLDVRAASGRGQEAAEALMQHVLKKQLSDPTW